MLIYSMEPKNGNQKKLSTVLYLVFVCGSLLILLGWIKGVLPILAMLLLLVCGYLVLRESINLSDKNVTQFLILGYIAAFVIEVVGVKTGMIFGDYKYGNGLGIKILGVPLVIGFNWLLLILGGAFLIEKQNINSLLVRSLLVGLVVVLIDFVLEPVAVKLNYWNWEGGVIPIKNYLAWFLVGFGLSMLFFRTKIKFSSNLILHYLYAQILFFLILRIFG